MTDDEWMEIQRACFRRTYAKVMSGVPISHRKPPDLEMQREHKREADKRYYAENREAICEKRRAYREKKRRAAG